MRLEPDNPLAAEIQQEAASSYFLACRKMVDSLEALRMFDQTRSSGRANDALRHALLSEAAERVFYVIIQREAMKLSADPAFFERYDIPPEVRSRLGPKR